MGEDRSRIRSNPSIFARARSFAFNILKANQTNTLSQDRYRASLAGFDNLLKLFGVEPVAESLPASADRQGHLPKA
jgi:hypothetical protein